MNNEIKNKNHKLDLFFLDFKILKCMNSERRFCVATDKFNIKYWVCMCIHDNIGY